MTFVLDNSIAMRWLLNDRDLNAQDDAQNALVRRADGEGAIVPNLCGTGIPQGSGRGNRR